MARVTKKTRKTDPPPEKNGNKNRITREAKRKGKGEDPNTWKTKVPFYMRLSTKQRIGFFKNLAIMTGSGIPLEKSLITMHEQASSSTEHRVLHALIDDVASGEFITTSMQKMPHVFDPLSVHLVELGETSGTLSGELKRIAEQLESARELRVKIISTMVYPIVVLLGTIGVALYLLLVLIPQLQPLFASLDVDLPITTRIVIGLSAWLLANWIWLLLGVIGAAALFIIAWRFERVRYAIQRVILAIPVVGPMTKSVQIAQFSRIIGTVLGSGMTIVKAVEISAEALENRVYRKALREIAASIQGGHDITSYLEEHPKLFTPILTQMVGVGESTGKLDETFLYIAQVTRQKLDEQTKTLTTLLEPITMLLLGGVVGFIAISIITPIYQLTQGIER